MSHRHDYSEAHACLTNALSKLDRTRRALGQTNLAPTGAPAEIIARIDNLDSLLQEASAEFQAARRACNSVGRSNLRLIDPSS